jgi:large subunit ribosomal protein L13
MAEREKIIIDAENATLGRLASYAAKQVIIGNEIVIINTEKAVITGSASFVKKDYAIRSSRRGSSMKGPIIKTAPEQIMKRTIRGMLPKNARGRELLKRVICYNSDAGLKAKIKSGKLKGLKYIRLDELARSLGRNTK